MSWWTDTHIKYYPFLFSQYITHPDCPEKYLIFPCHKIHRAGGRGRNEEFSLWPEISQNSVKKKKKKKSQCRQSLYVLQHYPVHFGNLSCACAISWAHPDESYSAQHRLHIGDLVMGIAKKLPVTSCWKTRPFLLRLWEVCFLLQ